MFLRRGVVSAPRQFAHLAQPLRNHGDSNVTIIVSIRQILAQFRALGAIVSLATLFWPTCIGIVLLVIAYLSWYSLQHIQRATDADRSYRAERQRVLTTYNTMHFRRIDDPLHAYDSRPVELRRRH